MKINNLVINTKGKLLRCDNDAESVVIPANVKRMYGNPFACCHSIKEIQSESDVYIVKNGCLYDVRTHKLITTICGEIVIPKEVETLDYYSLDNCTAVSFEKGSNIILELSYPRDSLYLNISQKPEKNTVYNTVKEEVFKNIAKKKKMGQIDEVSASLLLKNILKKYDLTIQQYRSDDASGLVFPIGELGVELRLPDSDFMQWKEALPDFLTFISGNVTFRQVTDYCEEHHLGFMAENAVKYAIVADGVREVHFEEFHNISSLTLLSMPASVEKFYTVRHSGYDIGSADNLRTIIFKGTKKQWKAVKWRKWLNINTPAKVVHCADGDAELPIYEQSGSRLTGCNRLIDKFVIPNHIKTIGYKAFEECRNLTSLVVPDCIVSIWNEAFYGCYKLNDITFLGTKDQWLKIDKAEDWSYCIHIVHCTDGDVEIEKKIVDLDETEHFDFF
ncbi:MAG: leucine-rich repeat protein [Spirochaetales bacterium]|nr:leucine-rich repeat protein [Spirochaetales bacterium]